jgi:hypothetical protein
MTKPGRLICVFFSALLLAQTAIAAETVFVKYRGPLDLSPFDCQWIRRSSLVQRLCVDARERYVVVLLTGTYYHYCGVPQDTVRAWLTADSMGRYYNAYIKGHFDCRLARVPDYVRR